MPGFLIQVQLTIKYIMRKIILIIYLYTQQDKTKTIYKSIPHFKAALIRFSSLGESLQSHNFFIHVHNNILGYYLLSRINLFYFL